MSLTEDRGDKSMIDLDEETGMFLFEVLEIFSLQPWQ
jgi:hypothetical protein